LNRLVFRSPLAVKMHIFLIHSAVNCKSMCCVSDYDNNMVTNITSLQNNSMETFLRSVQGEVLVLKCVLCLCLIRVLVGMMVCLVVLVLL